MEIIGNRRKKHIFRINLNHFETLHFNNFFKKNGEKQWTWPITQRKHYCSSMGQLQKYLLEKQNL